MILSCNSCEKKFVVPDSAISASGRLVQCSSCGNKWKQFPISKPAKIPPKSRVKVTNNNTVQAKVSKFSKKKKQKSKKRTGPNLYSPEYLSKKHGLKISETSSIANKIKKNNTIVNFGFYSYLIVLSIFIITVLRILYFAEETIISLFPISEIYINYLFESLRNIMDIVQNFISGY